MDLFESQLGPSHCPRTMPLEKRRRGGFPFTNPPYYLSFSSLLSTVFDQKQARESSGSSEWPDCARLTVTPAGAGPATKGHADMCIVSLVRLGLAKLISEPCRRIKAVHRILLHRISVNQELEKGGTWLSWPP